MQGRRVPPIAITVHGVDVSASGAGREPTSARHASTHGPRRGPVTGGSVRRFVSAPVRAPPESCIQIQLCDMLPERSRGERRTLDHVEGRAEEPTSWKKSAPPVRARRRRVARRSPRRFHPAGSGPRAVRGAVPPACAWPIRTRSRAVSSIPHPTPRLSPRPRSRTGPGPTGRSRRRRTPLQGPGAGAGCEPRGRAGAGDHGARRRCRDGAAALRRVPLGERGGVGGRGGGAGTGALRAPLGPVLPLARRLGRGARDVAAGHGDGAGAVHGAGRDRAVRGRGVGPGRVAERGAAPGRRAGGDGRGGRDGRDDGDELGGARSRRRARGRRDARGRVARRGRPGTGRRRAAAAAAARGAGRRSAAGSPPPRCGAWPATARWWRRS